MTGFLLAAALQPGQRLVSLPCPVPRLLALAHGDTQSMGGWKAPIPTPCTAPAPAHGVETAPLGLPQSSQCLAGSAWGRLPTGQWVSCGASSWGERRAFPWLAPWVHAPSEASPGTCIPDVGAGVTPLGC